MLIINICFFKKMVYIQQSEPVSIHEGIELLHVISKRII